MVPTEDREKTESLIDIRKSREIINTTFSDILDNGFIGIQIQRFIDELNQFDSKKE